MAGSQLEAQAKTASRGRSGERDANARRRRTQAERSADTRARIVAAAVACVDELGFPRATAQRIARRARVSVGAVQHHFPSKAEILAAVLEDSFAQFSAAFEGLELGDAPLAERVSVFVDRAWRRYGSPSFRSTFEIILSARGEISEDGEDWAARPMLESTRRAGHLWASIFSNVDLPAAQQREILRFAFVSLAGLAMTLRLQRSEAAARRQLELLKTALVALLGAGE